MATTNRYTKIQFRLQIKFSGESLHTVLSKKWKCGITMWRPNEHTDNVRPRPLRRVRGPAIICQRLRQWDVRLRAPAAWTHMATARVPSLHPRERRARRSRRSVERAPRQNSPRSVDERADEGIRKRPSAGASLIQQRQSSPLARCSHEISREGRLKPALSVVRSKHAD